MARLRVVKDGVELQSLDLAKNAKPVLSLGRAPESDIRLDDRAIGREHAVILFNSKGVSIQKKSKFGKLSVNGADAAESALKPGDVISIADYQVRFEEDSVHKAVASAVAGSGAAENPPDLVISEDATNNLNVIQTPDADHPDFALESPGSSSESQPALESQMPPAEAQQEESLSVEGGDQNPQSGFNAPDQFGGDERTAMIAPTKVVTKLVFKPGDANVEEFVIKKPEISIGRGTNCDIVLTGKKASRKHVVIKRVGMNFVACDLGSANGTYVNGVKITEQELAGDDVLKIGETEFVFQAMSQEYFDQQQDFMTVPPEESAPQDMQMMGNDMPMDGANTPAGYDPNAGALAHPAMSQVSAFDPNQMGSASPIPGLGTATPSKKETLMDKFKRQPLPRKIMIAGAIGLVLFFGLFQEDEAPKKKERKPAAVTEKADSSFTALPAEKKQFVINTYQLAFDYYAQKDYDKAAYEIDKILQILPGGYKNAKDIKTYSQKAMEAVKAAEDEKRRKEAEEKLRAEVTALVAKAQALVDQGGKDAEIKEIFSQVLERDPDNPTILRLRQQLEEREQKEKAEAEAAREIQFKRKQLETLIAEGRALLKSGMYYEVIAKMEDAPVIYAGDSKLLDQAKALIVEAKSTIKNKLRPYVEAGQSAMRDGNLLLARDSFYRALKVDSRCKEAKDGLEKIKTILHERSKRIYTDAITAESVSDFKFARAKYKECLDGAMKEDIYYGRCYRKYKRFELMDRSTASDGGDAPALSPMGGAGGTDPEKPALPKPVDVDKAASGEGEHE